MSGYLEAYGAAEAGKARRIRLILRIVIAVVCAIIIAFILYAVFKNRTEQTRVNEFLSDLRAHQYQQAYALWGCTAATPCRDYSFDKFMEDWGPRSANANASASHISMTQSCGNGVLVRVDYPNAQPDMLFVDRSSKIISFAPPGWAECPGRHWHFGAFFKRLFGG